MPTPETPPLLPYTEPAPALEVLIVDALLTLPFDHDPILYYTYVDHVLAVIDFNDARFNDMLRRGATPQSVLRRVAAGMRGAEITGDKPVPDPGERWTGIAMVYEAYVADAPEAGEAYVAPVDRPDATQHRMAVCYQLGAPGPIILSVELDVERRTVRRRAKVERFQVADMSAVPFATTLQSSLRSIFKLNAHARAAARGPA